MDFIVQKATELGVSVIQPVLTERCVSRPDARSMAKKCERYRKIALERLNRADAERFLKYANWLPCGSRLDCCPKRACSFMKKAANVWEN